MRMFGCVPLCPPETMGTLLIGYSLTQNIKLKKKDPEDKGLRHRHSAIS